MTQINLPKQDQSGPNEWADVEDNDVAIANVVNGNLDNNNIAANAAIAHTKLANIPTGSILLGNGGTPTATALSGDATVSAGGALTVANSAITTDKINAAAVTTAKINDAAITTAKINDAAVTTAKINDAAVTAAKLSTVKAGSLDIYTAGQYTSSGWVCNTSNTTARQTLSSVPPGTYFISANANGEAVSSQSDEVVMTLAQSDYAAVALGTGTQKASFTPGITSGSKTNLFISTALDPGASANLKGFYSLGVVVTVTATCDICVFMNDPNATFTVRSAHVALFGIKS
jgi:hypothetical protein